MQEGLVTGCLNVFCQVDSTLRTAKKVVKLDTQMKGDELVTVSGVVAEEVGADLLPVVTSRKV